MPDRSLTYPSRRRCFIPAQPAWFRRLPAILAELEASELSYLDREAVEKLFGVKERRARQLLSDFAGPQGLFQIGNAAAAPRLPFLANLKTFAAGETVAAAEEERLRAGQQLQAAKIESATQQLRILIGDPAERPRFDRLPSTVSWRCTAPVGPGQFAITYDDGGDLLWQIAEFMRTASTNRDEFFAGTEPAWEK